MLNIREDPTSNEAFQTVPPNKLADTIPEHPALAHTISEHQDLHKTSSTTHVPYNASNQEDPPSNKGFQTVPSNRLAVTTPGHPVLAHAISEHSIPTVDRNTTKRIVKLKPPTSKDNPKRKRKEEKKMSSDNKMNNIKITDVFRRQPKSEQKTTPNKKISEEDNSELETGTDLHITSDVMHQGSKQMDSTKSLSISNQVLHNEMPDLAQNSNKSNPNNLMLSPGDQMNRMSGDQLNAIILSCNLLEKDTGSVLKTFAVLKK